MAITATQNDQLFKLVAGMFNAAPGGYYAELANALSASSIETLATNLGKTTAFLGVYPSAAGVPATFADAFLANVISGYSTSNANHTWAKNWIVSELTAGASVGSVVWKVISALDSVSTTDTNWGSSKAALEAKTTLAKAYVGTSKELNVLQATLHTTSLENSVTDYLTTGQDTKVGTAANDTFVANLSGNSSTLNSGDKIYGGSNTLTNVFSNGEVVGDTLSATLGGDSNFAIAAITTGIETVSIRSQSTDGNGNSGENNVTNHVANQGITVDAQEMVGVQTWENTDSRADLTIEDIRILNDEVTKDITIAWRNADSGSTAAAQATGTGNASNNETDYRVYFSPESLRTTSNSTNSITLRIYDDNNDASVGTATYKPVDKVVLDIKSLDYKGQTFSGVITSADGTYAGLVKAINDAFGANTALVGLTAELGKEFDSIKSGATERPVYGTNYEIIINGLTKAMNAVVYPTGSTKSTTGFDQIEAGTSTTELITSKIILDNVGRESEAGILEVGSMSTRSGVEKFEVTVDNNGDNLGSTSLNQTPSGSWVSTLRSTNNILQEVKVTSAADTATTRASSNVRTVDIATNPTDSATNYDYLYIGSGMDQMGNNLTTLRFQPELLNTDGLTDVKVFDASAMKGEVKLGASITDQSIRKYMNTQDDINSSSASNVEETHDDADFVYTGGIVNDTMNIAIDSAPIASRSTIVSGREDFTFSIDGNSGNDVIQVKIVSDALNGSAENWYSNQDYNNNITVSGGIGNDIIMTPGAGDVNINGNAGNDVIYADNTGRQTATVSLVSNDGVLAFLDKYRSSDVKRDVSTSYDRTTSDGTSLEAEYLTATTTDVFATYVFNADATAGLNGLRLDDLRGQTPVTGVKAVNATVTVNYKGLTATATIANSLNATSNVTITELDINQAIKDAINGNSVLSTLLTAVDGPHDTLVVTSKIDGAHNAADLTITFPTTALTTAQTAVTGLTAFNSATLGLLVDGYTTTSFALDNNNVALTGANSTATSDNTITGGAGDDVIVLGTTFGNNYGTATVTAYDDSNDTVVYNEIGFGNDTIVHFTSSGAGADALDFSGLASKVAIRAYAVGTNSTVAEVKAAATAIWGDSATTASKGVYLSVNGNKATAYLVTDGALAGDISVSDAIGTITMAVDQISNGGQALSYSGWSDLVNTTSTSGVIGSTSVYNSGIAVNTGTGTGTGTSNASIAVTAAGSVTDTSTVNTTYTVTAGNYTYSIAGFGAGDKIDFPADNTPTVVNSSYTDGSVTLQYANAGVTTLVTLTGLSSANDIAINSIADVNTVFGTGTIF